ncbi:MAG: adenylyltransferase/cytidyltransferase family protein [bacterium]|nr:adenylyltransferase/cytidyltransferase family protein [bacterium]
MKQNKKGKTIVYTYGVFDLFHRGHVELLKEAKALGDELVVGVFSDEVAESFKRKPAISLADRVHMVQHCLFVDKVVAQNDLAPDNNLKKIKPHVLAKGPGAGWEAGGEAPGAKTMQKIGGKVLMLSYHGGISTSEIIKRIKEN